MSDDLIVPSWVIENSSCEAITKGSRRDVGCQSSIDTNNNSIPSAFNTRRIDPKENKENNALKSNIDKEKGKTILAPIYFPSVDIPCTETRTEDYRDSRISNQSVLTSFRSPSVDSLDKNNIVLNFSPPREMRWEQAASNNYHRKKKETKKHGIDVGTGVGHVPVIKKDTLQKGSVELPAAGTSVDQIVPSFDSVDLFSVLQPSQVHLDSSNGKSSVVSKLQSNLENTLKDSRTKVLSRRDESLSSSVTSDKWYESNKEKALGLAMKLVNQRQLQVSPDNREDKHTMVGSSMLHRFPISKASDSNIKKPEKGNASSVSLGKVEQADVDASSMEDDSVLAELQNYLQNGCRTVACQSPERLPEDVYDGENIPVKFVDDNEIESKFVDMSIAFKIGMKTNPITKKTKFSPTQQCTSSLEQDRKDRKVPKRASSDSDICECFFSHSCFHTKKGRRSSASNSSHVMVLRQRIDSTDSNESVHSPRDSFTGDDNLRCLVKSPTFEQLCGSVSPDVNSVEDESSLLSKKRTGVWETEVKSFDSQSKSKSGKSVGIARQEHNYGNDTEALKRTGRNNVASAHSVVEYPKSENLRAEQNQLVSSLNHNKEATYKYRPPYQEVKTPGVQAIGQINKLDIPMDPVEDRYKEMMKLLSLKGMLQQMKTTTDTKKVQELDVIESKMMELDQEILEQRQRSKETVRATQKSTIGEKSKQDIAASGLLQLASEKPMSTGTVSQSAVYRLAGTRKNPDERNAVQVKSLEVSSVGSTVFSHSLKTDTVGVEKSPISALNTFVTKEQERLISYVYSSTLRESSTELERSMLSCPPSYKAVIGIEEKVDMTTGSIDSTAFVKDNVKPGLSYKTNASTSDTNRSSATLIVASNPLPATSLISQGRFMAEPTTGGSYGHLDYAYLQGNYSEPEIAAQRHLPTDVPVEHIPANQLFLGTTYNLFADRESSQPSKSSRSSLVQSTRSITTSPRQPPVIVSQSTAANFLNPRVSITDILSTSKSKMKHVKGSALILRDGSCVHGPELQLSKYEAGMKGTAHSFSTSSPYFTSGAVLQDNAEALGRSQKPTWPDWSVLLSNVNQTASATQPIMANSSLVTPKQTCSSSSGTISRPPCNIAPVSDSNSPASDLSAIIFGHTTVSRNPFSGHVTPVSPRKFGSQFRGNTVSGNSSSCHSSIVSMPENVHTVAKIATAEDSSVLPTISRNPRPYKVRTTGSKGVPNQTSKMTASGIHSCSSDSVIKKIGSITTSTVVASDKTQALVPGGVSTPKESRSKPVTTTSAVTVLAHGQTVCRPVCSSESKRALSKSCVTTNTSSTLITASKPLSTKSIPVDHNKSAIVSEGKSGNVSVPECPALHQAMPSIVSQSSSTDRCPTAESEIKTSSDRISESFSSSRVLGIALDVAKGNVFFITKDSGSSMSSKLIDLMSTGKSNSGTTSVAAGKECGNLSSYGVPDILRKSQSPAEVKVKMSELKELGLDLEGIKGTMNRPASTGNQTLILGHSPVRHKIAIIRPAASTKQNKVKKSLNRMVLPEKKEPSTIADTHTSTHSEITSVSKKEGSGKGTISCKTGREYHCLSTNRNPSATAELSDLVNNKGSKSTEKNIATHPQPGKSLLHALLSAKGSIKRETHTITTSSSAAEANIPTKGTGKNVKGKNPHVKTTKATPYGRGTSSESKCKNIATCSSTIDVNILSKEADKNSKGKDHLVKTTVDSMEVKGASLEPNYKAAVTCSSTVEPNVQAKEVDKNSKGKDCLVKTTVDSTEIKGASLESNHKTAMTCSSTTEADVPTREEGKDLKRKDSLVMTTTICPESRVVVRNCRPLKELKLFSSGSHSALGKDKGKLTASAVENCSTILSPVSPSSTSPSIGQIAPVFTSVSEKDQRSVLRGTPRGKCDSMSENGKNNKIKSSGKSSTQVKPDPAIPFHPELSGSSKHADLPELPPSDKSALSGMESMQGAEGTVSMHEQNTKRTPKKRRYSSSESTFESEGVPELRATRHRTKQSPEGRCLF